MAEAENTSGSLGGLAAEASEAVARHKARRESATLVNALNTRLDELERPARNLSALATAARLLRARGLPRLDRKTVNRLRSLRARLGVAVADLARDPKAISAPNALPTDAADEAYALGESHIADFWQRLGSGSLPGEGMLAVFQNTGRWAATLGQLRALRSQITTLTKRLPAREQDLSDLDANVEAAKAAFAALPDLDEAKKNFLQGVLPPGFVLSDLLADPGLLKWVRDEGLDKELRVAVGSQPSQPPSQQRRRTP